MVCFTFSEIPHNFMHFSQERAFVFFQSVNPKGYVFESKWRCETGMKSRLTLMIINRTFELTNKPNHRAEKNNMQRRIKQRDASALVASNQRTILVNILRGWREQSKWIKHIEYNFQAKDPCTEPDNFDSLVKVSLPMLHFQTVDGQTKTNRAALEVRQMFLLRTQKVKSWIIRQLILIQRSHVRISSQHVTN